MKGLTPAAAAPAPAAATAAHEAEEVEREVVALAEDPEQAAVDQRDAPARREPGVRAEVHNRAGAQRRRGRGRRRRERTGSGRGRVPVPALGAHRERAGSAAPGVRGACSPCIEQPPPSKRVKM